MTAIEAADVIVVGAGVQGASAAFHLTKRGFSVLLLERSSMGAGATGRSSGFVRMHYDLESECRLAWKSFRYFRDWSAIVGLGDPGYVKTGFVQIVEPGSEEALRRNIAMQQRVGIDTQLVSAADLADIAPGLFADDVGVAAFEPQSGYADPAGTAYSFVQAARASGLRFRTGVQAMAVRTNGSRVVGISSADGRYDAPLVILAAGAWTASLGATVGLDIPVVPWREHTAYFTIPGNLAGKFPAVIDDIGLCSFRPEGEKLLLSAVADANETGMEADSPMRAMPTDVLEGLADRLSRRMPLMADAGFHSSQSGQDGMTPDQRAILGPAGPDGLFLLCGFSGTGFKTAPAVGLCMAELIADGKATTVDISAYGIGRFEAGEHLVGEHPYPAMWRDVESDA